MNDWLNLINTPEAGGMAGGVIRWLSHAETLRRLAANMFVGFAMAYYLAPVIIYSLVRYFELPAAEIPAFENVAGIGVGVCCGIVGMGIVQILEKLAIRAKK